ncbi:SPFH domain-containing protein [Olsenella sp. Marseille-P4559]|uniref:SPFH domain-containing protein n=1 Tax=Olsenella sp. Marseille-P4559 TaxID=2364795 RepID=UPI00102FF1C1|nr:SPFH domain-containing protein [Olsenella sp. Marseille-P4559]
MSTEKIIQVKSGWAILAINVLMYIVTCFCMIWSISLLVAADNTKLEAPAFTDPLFAASFVLLFLSVLVSSGFIAIQPGEAKVCLLFGNYVGTIRDSGFYWANPFYSRTLGSAGTEEEPSDENAKHRPGAANIISTKVSLRARTHDGERIKVNDKQGNPIEIATVVVWHVTDTAKALFDVDDYVSYVSMQTETALRHAASIYAYDHMEDDDASNTSITLRSNIEEVSASLREELVRRLAPAGVEVDDARLTHLAYAPEIAPAMLRRQQAEAIIVARKKIVEGAVSMVDMALSELSDGGIVEFDDDRKATMASNLMVVLCGESEAQPVLNTSSLY